MATTPVIPVPQSFQQTLSDMITNFASATGIPSISVGGVSLSLLETMALAVSRASGDVFQTLLNSSLQYATSSSLQLIAAEFGITPTPSQVATGFVSVTDTSFQVVQTTVYPGANAINIGSTFINASSNVGFPSSGAIYVGRGTNDSEGPLNYTSITAIGNYFQFNLSSNTQKFHNLGESIILSQGGNRTVPVNTIVLAPSNGIQLSQQYSVTQQAILLDGQNTVTNVPITALLPGSAGNVSSNTITQFSSPPFPNATCTNPSSTSGGTDPATDDQLRTQIQNVLSSIGLGTATAIKNSVLGATSSTESGSVTSDELITNSDGSSTLYISTGSSRPYEAKTAGVAIEHIVDNAIGGEQYFQLQTGGTQAPVAKAFVVSSDSSPFQIYGGYVLAVIVGGVTTQHTFQTSDFQAPGAATAYEICASINADTNLNFQATTSGDGTYVVLSAIAEIHETIQVTVPSSGSVTNANNYLGFPETSNETLWLYKNNELLSEDGQTASVFTQQQSLWSNSIASGDTLIIAVDGTSSITYTITNADFIATGLYTTVSSTNSLASWVEVFNNKITGITASIVGTQIELTSNLGFSSRAQVAIDPSSSLVSKSMFGHSQLLSAQGAAADYTLNRNTAQIELTSKLSPGDNLSAGTANTKGIVTGSLISGGSLDLSSEGYIWLMIDEPVTFVNTGVTAGTYLSVSASGSTVSYVSSVTSSFAEVKTGDYVIVWSPQLDATNRLEGRVHSITTTTNANDTLNMVVTSTEAGAVVIQSSVLFEQGFVVIRSDYSPQKFDVQSGNQTLDVIAAYLQTQTDSLSFGVSLEEYLTVSTNTINSNGSVTVVTFDLIGEELGFTAEQSSASQYPIIAYQDTNNSYMPAFFHSTISSDTYASPPDSFLTSLTSNISTSGREPNEIITFLNPYGGIDDEQPENEIVQETTISGTAVSFTQDPDVRRLRQNDRYFLSSPLSFGNSDTMTVVIDNNPGNYTFQVPFYRAALTNTTYGVNSTNFNAYDSSYGPTGNFAQSFGSAFNFSNYKVLMQAKKTLSSVTQQSSILYRSVQWGSTGEQIVVSYIYSGSAVAITSSVTVGSTIDIAITVPPSTNATAVAAYVNSNLNSYITATVVNDGSGGTPGSGNITANASTQLLDGINWLYSSNISSSPQFVFKEPLTLPSDVGYAFNNGETVLFCPTTFDQVSKYLNVLPVSGLATASLINPANRDSVVEISSDTSGSGGYVNVVGGAANGYSFPVLESALNIGNIYCSISASNTASSGVVSGQWFYLSASNPQQKDTGFGDNTDVTITPNSPSAGYSTIQLTNQDITQRYFGAPRVISGLSGLTFRVEAQGDFVCFSYVNSTSSPQYLTFPVDFNASGGGTLSVSLVAGTSDAQYTILTGAATFANINIGDLVTVSGLSNSGNNGTFMVTGSGQISSQWVLQVTNPSAATEASDTYSGSTFSATTGVMEGDTVIIGSPFAAANQGTYRVIRTFNDSFWIKNTDYVEEEQTLSSSSLTFYQYEVTIPSDELVISGTAFGANSAGTWPITTVTSPTEIVVHGTLSSASSVNLNGLLASFYVEEGTPYTGYKQAYLVALQPGTTNQNQILFNTYLQYEKINQAAGVEVTSMGKLGFPTYISQGLDGYKYNTGLIQECNRIIYGDTTDDTEYPGVNAAGTTIYVEAPLGLVITLAIDVRLQTGAPYSSVVQQIQSNVAALINSSPIGQSIAISSIVAVCTVVPGVVSVAISSPNYSPTNDLIVVQPSEQTFVLDASNISVSLIT